MRLFALLFLFLGDGGSRAFAEYRMFTLKITNTETQDYRLVNSTLDPLQYPAYYPVRANEIVQYTDTWRCFGRTSPDIPPCPNPRAATPPAESPVPAANP